MKVLTIVCFVLAYRQCNSRAIEEDSVVSVYTTQPTTSGPHPSLDVYHQIANNIADRITSPIFRFLGIRRNNTETEKTTKRPWEKIEILDDATEETIKSMYLPVDNDISGDRDVEELSVEVLKKTDSKPEKITLFSSYLPVKSSLENNANETSKEVDDKSDEDDDSFTLDDVDDDGDNKSRDSYFIYFIELLSSAVQLAWGGLTALFKASCGNSSSAGNTP